MDIRLVKNPDISAECARMSREDQILAGFSLETDHELDNAVGKLRRKGLDMMVLNSLRDKGAGFRTDTNKVTIITADGAVKEYPLKPKSEVAADIVDCIAKLGK